MNADGTTGEGDSFLTLDLVCGNCHSNMTMQQLANAAKFIHREPGLVDVTVNGADKLPAVNARTNISVNFSIHAGDKAGQVADWFVLAQGPKGWSSWDGSKWKSGIRAWRKKVKLVDVSSQNVLKGKLAKGAYTYWVKIDLTDGSEYYDSAPVYVTK